MAQRDGNDFQHGRTIRPCRLVATWPALPAAVGKPPGGHTRMIDTSQQHVRGARN
jgi:hypothetical protein